MIISCLVRFDFVSFQTKAALIYDSVYVFAIALQALEQSHKLRISNVSCTAETPWNGGLSLVNYINGVSNDMRNTHVGCRLESMVVNEWIQLRLGDLGRFAFNSILSNNTKRNKV